MDTNRWNVWRDFHLSRFANGLSFMYLKGSQLSVGRKGITAISVAPNGLAPNPEDVFVEAVRNIQQRDADGVVLAEGAESDDDQLDSIAMFGHGIGILENHRKLGSYLADGHQVIAPHSQILLCSFSATTMDKHTPDNQQSKVQRDHLAEGEMQFRYGDIIGPFFGLFQVDITTLEEQTTMASWQFDVIHKQGQNDYIVRLKQ